MQKKNKIITAILVSSILLPISTAFAGDTDAMPVAITPPPVPLLAAPRPAVAGSEEALKEETAEHAMEIAAFGPPVKEHVAPPQLAKAQYTVKDAIFYCLEFNAKIKAGSAANDAVKVDKYKAYTEFAPTVIASSNIARFRPSSAFVRANPLLYNKDSRVGALTVNQPLFTGGSTISNIKRTSEISKASGSNFKDLQNSIILNAITAYEALRTSRSVYDLNTKNEEALLKYLELTKIRLQYGAVTKTDLVQVESRLSTAKANKIRAQRNLRVAEAQFEHIIGHKAPIHMEPISVKGVKVPGNLDELIASTMSGNPELLSAKHSYKAAKAGVNMSMSRLLPTVSASATRQRSNTNKDSTFDNDGDTVGLNISIPLFQSGAEYADIQKSRLNREQARYNAEEASLQAREDAIGSWEAYSTSQSVLHATSKAVEAAEQAFEFVSEEAKAGTRTSLNVLDAELEMFSARVDHQQAEAESVLSVFAMHRVTGDLLEVVDVMA